MIITVSRELGSGGRDIAGLVANRLNIACIDREIISRAAERAGVTEQTIEELDEKRPSFIRQMLDLMGKYGDQGIYTEWGGPSTMYVPPPQRSSILDTETYRKIVEEVILGMAAQQSAVIIGRAAQMILRDNPDAFHVRIVAEFEHRVRRVMERENVDRFHAEKRAREADHQRSEYLRSYYKADWRDPHLYEMVLNTSRLGIEGCAELIVHAVAQKQRPSADQPASRETASDRRG